MISRRRFLQMATASGAGFLSLGGYAVGIEASFRLTVARWDMPLAGWPAGAKPLRAAILTDLHACEPWMPVERIAAIVAQTNALAPDVVFMLGDYVGLAQMSTRVPRPSEWAAPFARLTAPLGVHAILGNHDYTRVAGPRTVADALTAVGVQVLLNEAVKIERDGHAFWVAGTESATVVRPFGRHDIGRALAQVRDDAPVLLLAHEPAQITGVPKRVALTLSGHTHGGQVRLPFVGAPIARLHGDLAWVRGRYDVDGRPLLVSSGLGCSILPVRFMVPPEVAVAEIRSAAIA